MSELKKNPGPDYVHLLAEVKEHFRSAQYAALKAVNTELVGLYWETGLWSKSGRQTVSF
jgi:hypothetical protein